MNRYHWNSRYNQATVKTLLLLAGMIFTLLFTSCAQSRGISHSESTTVSPDLEIPAPTQTETKSEISMVEAPSVTPIPTHTSEIPKLSPSPTLTEVPALGPDEWKNLPIIPEISPNIRAIYQHGLELGNDPHAFSKIGDCGSTPAWFLGDFDRGPRFYDLGPYQRLLPVIDEFQGSFSRTSLAAKAGFNASSVFTTLWSDPKQCQSGEHPLACEYRLQRPIIAFITLGSNDVHHMDTFETQMRAIIEFSIDHGVIPILSTKADNLEGDGSINATIADLAREYDLPLLNYWQAVQSLPDRGLQDDNVHLTWGPNRFGDPQAMKSAWAVRNLSSLQVLNAVWKTVTEQSEFPSDIQSSK